MIKSSPRAYLCFLLFALLSISACGGQEKSSSSEAGEAKVERVASDWNQFLGPHRDGVITAKDQIPAKPELDVVWSRDLGSGYSGVLASDGYLFTMHTQGKNTVMTCMKADTGETVWQYDVAPFFPKEGSDHDGPRSTPALDQEQVYGLGARGDFFALKRDSGKLVWRVHLEDELGGTQPNVGFATSPLVIGNRVIVQIGNTDGKSIGAFDTKSGKLVWSSGRGVVGFQSPSLVNLLGKSYLIALNRNGITGLDPETGNELWSHQDKDGVQVLPTGHDGFLLGFLGSDYVHYSVTDSMDSDFQRMGDGAIALNELWRNNKLQFLYDIPVVHDGLAMGFHSGASVVACLNLKTGERAWQQRMPGSGVVSFVDGHLVIWCNGELRLAKATLEAYEEVTMTKVFDSEKEHSYTTPSYAHGHFYLRNHSKIAAVKVTE